MNLDRLNCMNYQVNCELTGDFWYAQCGLRSLYEYSKISDTSFRTICEVLDTEGQITIKDTREVNEDFPERGELTLTMI